MNKIFISYSWDSDEHKEWVLSLANKLISDGIDVILDQYELKLGKSLTHFMESSVIESDRVLIIMTENYKTKADQRKGGVGYEYSIINSDVYKNQLEHKFIPVLRAGTFESSTPIFLKPYVALDMSAEEKLKTKYEELLRELYNEPSLKKPQQGEKPSFESKPVVKLLDENAKGIRNYLHGIVTLNEVDKIKAKSISTDIPSETLIQKMNDSHLKDITAGLKSIADIDYQRSTHLLHQLGPEIISKKMQEASFIDIVNSLQSIQEIDYQLTNQVLHNVGVPTFAKKAKSANFAEISKGLKVIAEIDHQFANQLTHSL